MSRGRRPNPAKLALLATEHHIPLGSQELPTPPDWLGERARKEWDRVIADMSKTFLLTPIDAISLATYCETYSLWLECLEDIRKNGQVIPGRGAFKANPHTSLAIKYLDQMRRCAQEYGFTPLARTRLTVPTQPSEEDTDFANFENAS